MWALTGGVAFCACRRRLVAKRTIAGGPPDRRKVYHYLVCSSHTRPDGTACEHARCHLAGETQERVGELVLGLLRDPKVLREEV